LDFLHNQFPDGSAPQWVHDALHHADINISAAFKEGVHSKYKEPQSIADTPADDSKEAMPSKKSKGDVI
jgi:hypothetical protein